MRVLILTSWYPNKKNIISGVFVREQVKALQINEVNPVVFYPFDTSLEKGELICNNENGINTYRANTDYVNNTKLSKLNSIYISIKMMKRIINENKIEIINAHVCYEAGIIAYIYNKLYKIPYVITEHRSNIRHFASKYYNNMLFKAAYGNAKKVITVSKFLNEELKTLGYNFTGEIIGNTVDTNKFYVSKRNRIPNEYNLLFVGSMKEDDVKGLHFFIPALMSFIKNHKELKITTTFVGEGEKRAYFMQLFKDNGFEEQCNFIGNVAKERIPEFMADCDIFVLPSIKETFGAVLIEAMASGKPVLATKCGGPEEFVNEDVGVLVQSGSIHALEKGISTIINNFDKYDSETIKDYAKTNYDYKIIGSKIKKVLEESIRN